MTHGCVPDAGAVDANTDTESKDAEGKPPAASSAFRDDSPRRFWKSVAVPKSGAANWDWTLILPLALLTGSRLEMLRIDTLSTAQPPDAAIAQTNFCLSALVKLLAGRGMATTTRTKTDATHALDEFDPAGENEPVLQGLGPKESPSQ
jgi:hypothetical protein